MDLTHLVLDAVWRPSFLLKYPTLKDNDRSQHSRRGTLGGEVSALMKVLDEYESPRWRVDGATICGTQFFCTPINALPNLKPTRIDIFLPDQDEHPRDLRQVLESSASVVLRDGQTIRNLPICKYLCFVLDTWCDNHPDFLNDYEALPFGSKVLVKNIEADVAKVQLVVIHAHDLERQSLSIKALKKRWAGNIAPETWPQTFTLESLLLVEQFHDSVSLVKVVSETDPRLVIFKSNVTDFHHLYHELKFLLTTDPHDHIMERPLGLVTKKSRFGGKNGVIGFLLPYYRHGSIRDVLPARARKNLLSYPTQLKWCQQVTSALIHIYEYAETFYSDLRPDNVLLIPSQADPSIEDVKLCDFEQRGNWHEWCSPEVLYRQYAQNLSTHTNAPVREAALYQTLVRQYLGPRPATSLDSDVDPKVVDKNRAWFDLGRSSAEKSMVYSLGLFIYCVFEGLSNCCVSIGNAYPIDPDREFPKFELSPPPIRKIIRACTADAPEWAEELSQRTRKTYLPRARKIVRQGYKILPEGTPLIELDELSEYETKNLIFETALRWWQREVARAEQFLESPEWKQQEFGKMRPTLREVACLLEQAAKGDSC